MVFTPNVIKINPVVQMLLGQTHKHTLTCCWH